MKKFVCLLAVLASACVPRAVLRTARGAGVAAASGCLTERSMSIVLIMTLMKWNILLSSARTERGSIT